MPRTRSNQRRRAASRLADARPHAHAALESLEARVVLAAVSWDWGGGNRLWSDPLNWSGDVLPTELDDVTIDLGPGIATEMMVADLPVIRVKSLTINDTLVINRGTSFNVNEAFDIQSEGSIRINGLVNWVQGVWSGNSPARVHPGGLLNVGASLTPGIGEVTLDSDLLNRGTLSWRGGDFVVHGTITSEAGKALNMNSPGVMSGNGAIVNNGLLRRNGDALTTTTIAVDLTSTDRVFLLRGTLSIGQEGAERVFTDAGRVLANRTDSTIRYFSDTSHVDARLLGRGSHEFIGGAHVFEGESFLGLQTRFLDGAEFIAVGGVDATGHVTFDGATLTLDGDLVLRRFQFQSYHATQHDVFLFDTLVQGSGTLTIEANASTRGSAFNVTTQTDILQIGDANPHTPGIAIGPGATLSSIGWLNFLSGRIDMAADATLDKIRSPFRIYGSHIGGQNPGEGSLILRNGQSVRYTAIDGPDTTTINADVEFNAGPSSGSNHLLIQQGHVIIAGDLASLRVDPVTGYMTLYDLTLSTIDNSTLRLPYNVESIGEGSGVSARASFTNLPQLRTLREVRGSLTLSGSGDRTYTFETDVLVNHGRITKGNLSGLVTLTNPIDNRAGATINVFKNGLEITGFLDENNEFINHGTIECVEGGTLIIHVDQGGVQGTMVNLGRFHSRGNTSVLGSFENASGGRLELNAGLNRTTLEVSREMVQAGELYMFVYTTQSPWTSLPVAAGSYSGEYADIKFSRSGTHWSYLPNGALQVSR